MYRGTILLVDNEPSILPPLRDFLESKDYLVHTAGSPEEAMDLLSRQRVHLAVIDLRLRDNADERDTSGIALAKEIDPLIPCIILTTFVREISYDVVVEALRADLPDRRSAAVDFISKGEGPQALLEAIKRAFEQYIGINFQLPVTVTEGHSLKEIAQRAFGEEKKARLSLSLAVIEEEIRELLQKLFREAISVEISLRLPPGCGEEEAMLVRWTTEEKSPQRPTLVRFTPRDRIEGASRADLDWQPAGLNTSVMATAVVHHIGAVAYDFSRDFAAPDVLALTLQPGQAINVDFQGEETAAFETQTTNPLHLDVERRKREARNARCSDDQRFDIKHLGQDLYKDIFTPYPEVTNSYHQAVGQTGEANLHLIFKTQRDLLSLPLEFLFWGSDWAVLRHPLSRFVLNAPVRRQALSPAFLRRCHRRRERVRILLIASNTPPSIPGCEREVEILAQLLPGFLRDSGMRYEITVLPTKEATLAQVREELQNCPYHVLHYSGHGYYDPQNPEESCLFFWDDSNGKRKVGKLTGQELKLTMKSTRAHPTSLRFAYLSCCWGAAGAKAVSLLDNDFLGIADALVQAGVPAVLSYRWPVSDDGAEKLALAFYKSLFAQGHLATALLEARCHVAGRLGRDDTTWLSPILICQD
ncbi:MAG: CHAT domain-containing protein [Anaerolineae bacterium]